VKYQQATSEDIVTHSEEKVGERIWARTDQVLWMRQIVTRCSGALSLARTGCQY
jgi:hypothetical protein